MVQPNFEDLDPTDTPSAVPTTLQASSDHTSNPKCAHNLIATLHNQSQYLTSLNKICTHNPSTSQVSQTNPSNSMAFPYPPDPGEHGLKRSSISTGEQDFPLNGHQGPPNAPDPNLKRVSIMSLLNGRLGRRLINFPQLWQQML